MSLVFSCPFTGTHPNKQLETSTLARAQVQTHNPVESAAALELVTSGTLAVIATPARKRDSDLATTAAAAAAAAAAAFAAVVKETAVATIDSEAMALPVGAAAKQAAKPAAARLRASKRHAWTQRQRHAQLVWRASRRPGGVVTVAAAADNVLARVARPKVVPPIQLPQGLGGEARNGAAGAAPPPPLVHQGATARGLQAADDGFWSQSSANQKPSKEAWLRHGLLGGRQRGEEFRGRETERERATVPSAPNLPALHTVHSALGATTSSAILRSQCGQHTKSVCAPQQTARQLESSQLTTAASPPPWPARHNVQCTTAASPP